MYFSFIYTSDLIIIRSISCSFLLHIKYEKHLRQYLAEESVRSKYIVEPESKKSYVNDIFNWLSIVRNVTLSFESISYNSHAPIWMALRNKGGNFLNLLQKEGSSLRKEESQPWRKLH